MRKVIDDGPDRELALHMKRGLELAGREQVSIDATQARRLDIDEQARAAFATGDAGIALEFPRHRVAADDLDGVGGIRRIGAPMHRLAVVAMAVELDDRFGGDFNLDRSAAALDLGHAFGCGSGRRFRQHPRHAFAPIGALGAEVLHDRAIKGQRHRLERCVEFRPAGTPPRAFRQSRKDFGKWPKARDLLVG
jgi:hypothetical protein